MMVKYPTVAVAIIGAVLQLAADIADLGSKRRLQRAPTARAKKQNSTLGC